jgi:hypothetical protein
MIQRTVTYGQGGYDPDAPDDNIVSVVEVEVPDPEPDVLPVGADAIVASIAEMTPAQKADLRAALGL